MTAKFECTVVGYKVPKTRIWRRLDKKNCCKLKLSSSRTAQTAWILGAFLIGMDIHKTYGHYGFRAVLRAPKVRSAQYIMLLAWSSISIITRIAWCTSPSTYSKSCVKTRSDCNMRSGLHWPTDLPIRWCHDHVQQYHQPRCLCSPLAPVCRWFSARLQ